MLNSRIITRFHGKINDISFSNQYYFDSVSFLLRSLYHSLKTNNKFSEKNNPFEDNNLIAEMVEAIEKTEMKLEGFSFEEFEREASDLFENIIKNEKLPEYVDPYGIIPIEESYSYFLYKYVLEKYV